MSIAKDQQAGYCCPNPQLQFGWLLGTQGDDLSKSIVRLEGLQCLTCGTEYEFDDGHGTRCPMVNLSADRKAVTLSVRRKPRVVS